MWDYFLAENCSFFHSPAAALAMFLFGFVKKCCIVSIVTTAEGSISMPHHAETLLCVDVFFPSSQSVEQ